MAMHLFSLEAWIVLILLSISLGTTEPLTKTLRNGRIHNVDGDIVSRRNCQIQLFCVLKQPLRLKPPTDALDDNTLGKMLLYLLEVPGTPKVHVEQMTVEKLRDEKFWTEVYAPTFCSLGKDKLVKLLDKVYLKFMTSITKICFIPSEITSCKSLKNAMGLYNKLHDEMIRKRECDTPELR